MDSRRLPHASAALAAAVILAATLTPDKIAVNGAKAELGSSQFQLADVLRNVILFTPLGASLAWSGLVGLRAALLGGLLSASIELSQHYIPGRYPSAIDWISNTTGAALGAVLFQTAPAWLWPPPRLDRTLAIAASAAATAILVATGILLAAAPSMATYFGQRPAEVPHLAPYAGTVLDARLDDLEIPAGRIEDSDWVRTRLRGDYRLRVRALAGPPPADLAGLVFMSDSDYNEILVLGPDREDLVYRFRSRSQLIGLEPATLRLPRALRGIEPGAPFTLEVQRTASDLCVEIDGVLDCGHGFTAGDGWLLLAPDFRILAPLRSILGVGWIAILFAPLGYWGRGLRNWARVAACAAAGSALFFAPGATGLLSTPARQLAGAGLGAVFGMASRRHLDSRPGHGQTIEGG